MYTFKIAFIYKFRYSNSINGLNVNEFNGIVIAFVLEGVFHRTQPTLDFVITADWVLKATGIALAGALLGAFYPALKAARKDPIDALAYE